MYFSSEELKEFFKYSDVTDTVKKDYHVALPWDYAQQDGKVVRERWSYEIQGGLTSFDYDSVDMDRVVSVMHDRIAQGSMLAWKALRPWVVCDVTANLDPEQPWIGWEIETGWNSYEDRYKVVKLFNKRYMYSCTDDEGWGSNPVELTFSPQVPDYYTKRDNPLHPLLFVANHKARANVHQPRNLVGTHVNFSTPAFRKASTAVKYRIVGALNNSLATLSFDEKEQLFGRGSLYAGCFIRGDGAAESSSGTYWVEGKLFNSTYEWDVAKNYIEVGNCLCSVMEQLTLLPDLSKPLVVNNFYRMLTGEDTSISTELASYDRDGDDVSSEYAEDDDEGPFPNPPDGEWEDEEGQSWCTECGVYH